jgi:hypothetical protein
MEKIHHLEIKKKSLTGKKRKMCRLNILLKKRLLFKLLKLQEYGVIKLREEF